MRVRYVRTWFPGHWWEWRRPPWAWMNHGLQREQSTLVMVVWMMTLPFRVRLQEKNGNRDRMSGYVLRPRAVVLHLVGATHCFLLWISSFIARSWPKLLNQWQRPDDQPNPHSVVVRSCWYGVPQQLSATTLRSYLIFRVNLETPFSQRIIFSLKK
jgi:hypothetical protein